MLLDEGSRASTKPNSLQELLYRVEVWLAAASGSWPEERFCQGIQRGIEREAQKGWSLQLFQMLEVWPSPGDCGFPVRDRSGVPSGLGPVLVEELEGDEGKNAVKEIVVGETEADRVLLWPPGRP